MGIGAWRPFVDNKFFFSLGLCTTTTTTTTTPPLAIPNMSDRSRTRFLQVYQNAEHAAQDEAEANPFPVYIDDDENVDALLAPFCPTSARRVLKALEMAGVRKGDHLIDLGSGDGRFCTAAVMACGAASALGIETDEALVDRSWQLAREALGEDKAAAANGLSWEEVEHEQRLRFVQGDLLSLETLVRDTRWTVLVLFLLPDHTHKYADMLLEHYRRGARIISLVFDLNEVMGLNLLCSDDPEGIYIYGKQ